MFLSYINYVSETNLLSLVFLFWLLPVPAFLRSPRSPVPSCPSVPSCSPRSLPFPFRSPVPFLAPVPPGFPGGLSFWSFWFLPVYPPLPQPFIRPSFHKH